MKRRFLALALALVMVMSLLPASIFAVGTTADQFTAEQHITKTEEVLGGYTKTGTGFVTVDETSTSATLTGEFTHERTGFEGLEKKNVFASVKDEFIILDLDIKEMPVFTVNEDTDAYDQASAHVSSGLFLTANRNYIADDPEVEGNQASLDYIKFAIVRTDDAGNLSIAISNNSSSTEMDTPYPLNRKVGDGAFKLMAHWHEDGRLDLYCDGTLVHSYDETATYTAGYNSGRKHFLRVGYSAYGAAVTDAVPTMNVDIDINSLSLGAPSVHTAAADDGQCSTPLLCADCGYVMVPARDYHCFDQKVASETFKKEAGVYYLSCTCGASSAGTPEEATFSCFDLSAPNTNKASTDATPVQFDVTGIYTATLSGNMARANSNYASLDFTDTFTGASLVEHVTQTILINDMPVIVSPNYTNTYYATGYFNTLTRNYGTATATPLPAGKLVADCCDTLMYSIYRKDAEGNLGMKIYVLANDEAGAAAYTSVDVEDFAEILGTSFTLTTVWNADNSVTFVCDGESLGTFEGVTYPIAKKSARKNYLSIGYTSFGTNSSEHGDGTVNLTVSNVKIAHAHEGGTATCREAAKCADCGAVYGELGDHAGGTATCQAPANCATCGEAYGDTVDHTVGTPATCSAKAICGVCGQSFGMIVDHTPDENGSCTVCGNATGYEDLSGATLGNKSNNLFALTKFGASVNNAALALNVSGNTSDYSAVLKQVFTTSDVTAHVSQTITITAMPVFETAADVNAYTGQGYYNNLRRNYDSSAATVDSVMYYIFPDVDGNLNLWIKDDSAWTSLPLNRELGDTFRLTTAWHTDDSVSFYCDGTLLHTFGNATAVDVNHQSKHYSAFTMGFSSRGATADDTVNNTVNVNMSVTNVVISETHSGGNATCTEQAKCDYCGEAYGDLGNHTGGSATCTTKPTCDVCGEAYGVYADHAPNAEGICSVCGAATGYMDLEVEDRVSKGKNSTTLMTLSKFGAAINASEVELRTTAGSDYSAVLKSAFIVPDVAQHISQTINITAMPVFDGATHVNAYTGSGYYNNLRRNQRTELVEEVEKALVDYAMYSIYPDASGNLMLGVYSSSGWVYESLNRELGNTFRIDTVWHVDGSLSIYCDGYLVITVAEATTYGVGTQGDHYAAFTMGYSSYGANEAAYGTGAVNMSVSNIVISNGHIAADDDGNCMTGDVCSVCGAEFNEAQDAHVQPEDDGNCVTPVKCSNPGCTHVFVEGHELEHREEVPATDEATGTKEHWYCAADGFYYLDAAGTQKVAVGDLVISKNYEISDDKAIVSDDYVNEAINGAGEGDVALNVPTTEIELPAASMDALVTAGKPLVITTGEGKVTLNPEAITAIKAAAADSALSINVKKAGTSVLQDAQTAALRTYSAIKEVISAEMFGGSAITSFGEGTVTIEIPFTLDDYGTASEYKLVYVSDDGQTVEVIDNAVFADGKVTATLTHFSDYAIVYTGEVPEEPVEGNTTITTNGGSSFATVTGTYVDGLASGDVFSVDVEWDNLSFNYMAANTWDPETHTNTGGGWEENVTGSVTVTNHSNIAVTVTVTKEDIGTEKGLGVNFVGASTDNLDAGTPENVGAADYCVVEFAPKGTLVEGDTDVTLATITVTISKYEPQN